MGIDCFGRNTFGGGGYLSGEALHVAHAAGRACNGKVTSSQGMVACSGQACRPEVEDITTVHPYNMSCTVQRHVSRACVNPAGSTHSGLHELQLTLS